MMLHIAHQQWSVACLCAQWARAVPDLPLDFRTYWRTTSIDVVHSVTSKTKRVRWTISTLKPFPHSSLINDEAAVWFFGVLLSHGETLSRLLDSLTSSKSSVAISDLEIEGLARRLSILS